MPTWTIVLLVCIFLVVDIAVVGAVLQIAGRTVRELSAKFPARPVMPNAVRRNFQSFKFGLISLGGCIHVAADEDHLHLFPALVARWMKIKPMSIPWDSMRYRGSRWGSTVVEAAGVEIAGPKWVMDLAKANEAPLEPADKR